MLMRKCSDMSVFVSPVLMRRFGFALACAVALGGVRDCGAATFCVRSSAQFKSALGSSFGNGEDNTIYVKSGYYPLNTDLGDGLFLDSFANIHALTMIGSIDDISVCPPKNTVPDLAGTGTTLDGEHAVRPLEFYTSGHVEIRGFTIVGGLANGVGGGLQVKGFDVLIQYNRFIGNHASGSGASGEGGEVNGFADTTIRFIDNLLAANHGNFVGGAELYGMNGGEVSGNTITGNITDTVTQPGGLRLDGGGSANFTITNNIVWNNHATGGTDLGVFTAQSRAANDLYFPLTPGSTSAGFTSDVSVDPQFESCGLCLSFELADSSPLIDAGIYQNYPTDLAGKPRVIGPHIDIGAFENIAEDFIFANGFQ